MENKKGHSWLEKKFMSVLILILLLGTLMISPGGRSQADTIPPEITDVRDFPDPVPVGEQINIDCTVTDNVAVSSVKIMVFLPLSPPVNLSMAPIPDSEDGYYFFSSLDEPGSYEYFIWARDTSGNSAKSPTYGFLVQDITPPNVTVHYPNGGEILSGVVTIQWTASDTLDPDLDGDITVRYSIDGGNAYQTLDSELNNSGFYDWDTTPFLDADVYKIMVTATDDSGNSGSDFSDSLFTVDNAPPETTLETTGTMGNNGWYISNVTITLNASDAESGVNKTVYRINGGPWQNYTVPFVVSTEGNLSFEYYSIDNGGQIEGSNFDNVKIDKNPPVVTFDTPRERYFYIFDREIMRALLGTVIIGKLTVKVAINETGSGVERAIFNVDEETRILYTEEPFDEWLYDEPALFRHRHIIGVSADDFAGHEGAVTEVSVWVLNV